MIDCFWSLYNSAEEVRIDGLRTIQIQALLRCLTRTSLDEWMLWQEGTDYWRPASEVHAELQKTSGLFNVPPRPPPVGQSKAEKVEHIRKIAYEEDPESQSQISLISPANPREQNAMDKRINPRFILRLGVQITIGGKLHTNETINISMGGIKLKQPLPEGTKGVLDVKIVNGPHEMVLRCRTLQAKNEEQVTRLLIEGIPKPDVFRAWILAGT